MIVGLIEQFIRYKKTHLLILETQLWQRLQVFCAEVN